VSEANRYEAKPLQSEASAERPPKQNKTTFFLKQKNKQ